MRNNLLHRKPPLELFPAYLKILVFGMIVIVSLFLVLLLGALIGMPFFGDNILDQITLPYNLNNPEVLDMMKYFQIVSQIGLFLLPTLLFAYLVNRKVWEYLKLDNKPYLFSFIAGGLAIVALLPFISWLVQINQMLHLPESMTGVENWMQKTERQATEITEAFLSTSTVGGFIINLIMIAIIPAIGEEFFFRGILLRLFREWSKNAHVAVFISALLFSAFHLQFYGFVPRFLLGVFLGYLFVISKNLWVPVFVHFVNNALAVIALFMASRGMIETDIESLGKYENYSVIIISTIISILLIGLFYYYEKRKQDQSI